MAEPPRTRRVPGGTGLPEDKPLFPSALEPVRPRDKIIGVVAGLLLALLVIAIAYGTLGGEVRPDMHP